MNPMKRPVLAALAALIVAALTATGCVSVPTGGPVISYPVTQGTAAQNQPYVQVQPQPPGTGWSPTDIVTGFLTASASYGTYPQVVEQYLTPDEQKSWNPSWSAVVYKNGPNVMPAIYPSTVKNPKTATVKITIKTRTNGRRVANRCLAQTRKLRHRPRCLRTITLANLTRSAHEGLNRVRFTGRISGRPLKPGRYQARFIAVDVAGVSSPRTLHFTIVR